MSLVGPYLVACSLLVVAGSTKAVRPQSTARAVGGLFRRPSQDVIVQLVRLLAVFEAALGAVGAVLPWRIVAMAVAGSYVGFAVFVSYVRLRGGVLASCGCFSTPDTRPTRIHIAVDLILAASALAVWTRSTGAWMPTVLAHQTLRGIPLLASCALSIWLVHMVLVALPRLAEARQSRKPVTTVSR